MTVVLRKVVLRKGVFQRESCRESVSEGELALGVFYTLHKAWPASHVIDESFR